MMRIYNQRIASAIMLAVLITLVQSSRESSAEYNPDFEQEMAKIADDLAERGISAGFLRKYLEDIADEVADGNYPQADLIFDLARKDAERLISLDKDAITLKETMHPLEESELQKNASEKIKSLEFEIQQGNLNAAEKLFSASSGLVKTSYDLLRNNTIDKLAEESIYGRKIEDAIRYGKSLNSTDFSKIISFENEAESMLDSITKMEEMTILGQQYSLISDGGRFKTGIDDMILDFEMGHYEDVGKKSAELRQAFAYANKTSAMIVQAKAENYTSELATAGIRDAEEAYEKELFAESFILVEKAISNGEEERSQTLLASMIEEGLLKNASDFLKANAWTISAIILITAIFAKIKYPGTIRRYREFQISLLDKRKNAIDDAIKKAQEAHYISKKISRKTYEHHLSKYQEELAKIREKKEFIKGEVKEKEEKVSRA